MCLCAAAERAERSGDSLDAYMSTLSDRLDKGKKAELKHQLLELKKVRIGLLVIMYIRRCVCTVSLNCMFQPYMVCKHSLREYGYHAITSISNNFAANQ